MHIIDVPDRKSLGGRGWLVIEGEAIQPGARGVAFVASDATTVELHDLAVALCNLRAGIAVPPESQDDCICSGDELRGFALPPAAAAG